MEVISVKLNKFELNNFGIYYENIEIDLSTKDNNIILIGGENGAGKTTLLNAIKICLYGSISMGFKTNTEQYLNEIKNYYNYSADNENKRNMYLKMKLTLNFSLLYSFSIELIFSFERFCCTFSKSFLIVSGKFRLRTVLTEFLKILLNSLV